MTAPLLAGEAAAAAGPAAAGREQSAVPACGAGAGVPVAAAGHAPATAAAGLGTGEPAAPWASQAAAAAEGPPSGVLGGRNRVPLVPRQSLQHRDPAPPAAPSPPPGPVVLPPRGHHWRSGDRKVGRAKAFVSHANTPRAIHPEVGIDRKQLDRRESFTVLRIVAALAAVGALCAAIAWVLGNYASF